MQRKRGGASLPCPVCASRSRVMETRRTDDKIMRIRLCRSRKCKTRFISHERYVKRR